ncbi:hypothetical protein FPRO03_14130 [Fusarium proliferatum]|nr:hypothetical protein FPRO03_14130 [Fusarium proliferatum]
MEQPSPDPFQQPQQRKRKRRANSNLRQPSPSDYPLEDTGALENIFASYPQMLSTVPRPEGMRGLNEPSWALQFDHDIHLSNDYPVPNGQPTRVRGPIPGPEPILYPSQPSDATEEQHNTQSPRAKFKSALQLVTDVIGTERRLTRESLEAAERVRQWPEALEEGKWLLRLHNNPEHHQHNHGPSIGPSAHPSHRRLTEATKATIISTSRRVGVRARDVRAVIQEQYPDSTFTRKDIYNARSLINREKLGGLTPTAALIKLFDDNEIPYLIKWADDDPDRLLGLVWTFPYCLQMWKRFPEVISFDNTYNTNRFKLPLFQATGQTCLGSVFNAAFGLIDNERREGFQFLSESIKQLMEQHSIRQPDVIITDFDDSMKAALNDQFPDIQQQLCIHHINSNVLLRAKQRWLKRPSSSSDISGGSDIEADPPDQIQLNPTDQESISAPGNSGL